MTRGGDRGDACPIVVEILKGRKHAVLGNGAVVIGENVIPIGGGDMSFRLVAEYSSSKLKACQGTEFQKKKEALAVLKKSKILFDS